MKDLSDTDDYKYTKIFQNEIEELKAVIVVFSVVDHKTFEHAKMLIDFILKSITNNYMTFVLIGNKCDLIPNLIDNYVNFEEVEEYLHCVPNAKYFEVSCKTEDNLFFMRKYLENLDWDLKEDDDTSNISPKKKNTKSCIIF